MLRGAERVVRRARRRGDLARAGESRRHPHVARGGQADGRRADRAYLMRSVVRGPSFFVLALACVLAAVSLPACARAAQPAPASAIVKWQPLGSWSGRGRIQTESFNSDTGALRVSWKTTRKD